VPPWLRIDLIVFNCELTMAFFRQYIAPLMVVLIFALALVAVSARIFLPNEMAAPGPIGQIQPIVLLQ
jgi:hypothetical protein